MNRLFYLKLLIFLIVSALLCACATVVPPPSSEQLNAQQWVLQGRIAIKTAQHGENASFSWQQQGQQYAMRIYGPLGIGAVQIHGMPNDVVLTTSDGKQYQASSADILLQQTLGWYLPVNNLVYWIRGLPAPHVPAQAYYDPQHRLQLLQQQGWQVNYLGYYQSTQAYALPRLLSLSRANINVRIVIDQWSH